MFGVITFSAYRLDLVMNTTTHIHFKRQLKIADLCVMSSTTHSSYFEIYSRIPCPLGMELGNIPSKILCHVAAFIPSLVVHVWIQFLIVKELRWVHLVMYLMYIYKGVKLKVKVPIDLAKDVIH